MADARPGSPASYLPFLLPLGLLLWIWTCWNAPVPIQWPDSQAYLSWPADYVLNNGYRVMGARPAAFPLFLGLVGSGKLLTWVQTGLSLVAWSWCGAQLAGRPGATLGLLLAISPNVWQWNAMVLTESLSLSLWALLLGLTAKLRQSGRDVASVKVWMAWLATTIALSFVRDGHVYGVWPMFGLLVWWQRSAFLRSSRADGGEASAAGSRLLAGVGLGAVAGVCAMLTLWVSQEIRQEERWIYPVGNAITQRILPDESARAWFEARGMPISAEVLRHKGQMGTQVKIQLEAQAPEFQHWLQDSGLSTYQAYLLTHPGLLWPVVRALDAHWWRMLGYYREPEGPHYPLSFPLWPGHVIYCSTPPVELLLLLLAFVGGWTHRLLRRASLSSTLSSALWDDWALAAGISALMLSQAFLGFHGDAMEVPRHLLLSLVLGRVLFGLLLVQCWRLWRLSGSRLADG